MRNIKSNRLVLSSLLLAFGLALPYFSSHMFGIPGTVLLPMHFPVLLGGLLCGPAYGVLLGLLTPILSFLLTGMPAFYPMLPMMAVQLILMGCITGLLYQKLHWPLVPSLLLAMIVGWSAYGFAYALLFFIGNGTVQALSVAAALLKGIPGILLQLVLIPGIVSLLTRAFQEKKESEEPIMPKQDAFQQAIALVQQKEYSLVLTKTDVITHTICARGIAPLLQLFQESPAALSQAYVADKIVGKAVAILCVLGGVRVVYGDIMSKAAKEYLLQHGIKPQYGRCVDVISAKSGNGICPIERSVLGIDDPQDGLAEIQKTLLQLRSAK